MVKWLILILQFLLSPLMANAQDMPFKKGVNLTNWFQTGSPGQIQFTRYTKQDFENIQSLGCDVIRLPINLHFMTDGAPDYTIDPLFFFFLDQVVDWAEELQMNLILDNHTFDPSENTNPQIGIILEKVWQQMAQHYRERSELIYYEVLNEPHGISDALWNTIQADVIDVIRSEDTTHYIIVGPAGWNSFHNLNAMPVYNDEKLIYTFHFYDPFLFTHQGASWTDPSMVPLAGVPFPYSSAGMPLFPHELQGTWIESAFNNYPNEGSIEKVKALIDIAVSFKENRNITLFCGEFGVYIPNSSNKDRVFWYQQVRQYLESYEISWTTWDYHGGFGLFEQASEGLFDHHLNVELLEALDFIVPEQSDYISKPDSTGEIIYQDFVGENILSEGQGVIDFYHQNEPYEGKFCIHWREVAQYGTIGFNFSPDRDFSLLYANNYSVDFWIKGNDPDTQLDLRFVDSKKVIPEDRPWRNRIVIDKSIVEWDGRWHHLTVPFSSFMESGAWDNGWYNPIGAFNWAEIDRLEFVSEYSPFKSNQDIWIDQIKITDLGETVSIKEENLDFGFNIYPNPVGSFLSIDIADIFHPVYFAVINMHGQTLKINTFEHSLIQTGDLPPGSYFLILENSVGTKLMKRFIKF